MAHPWISGEHFATLEPGQAGTGPMTASVRRLMVNNAKRKFRACAAAPRTWTQWRQGGGVRSGKH